MPSNKQPLILSDNAARQVKESAEQSNMQSIALRIAVEKLDSGELRYAMGFDDVDDKGGMKYESNGVEIVIPDNSIALLQDTILDYVKLDDGEKQFVFLNPNDPNYSPENTK